MLLVCMVLGRVVCCVLLLLHAVAASEQKRHCINPPWLKSVCAYTLCCTETTLCLDIVALRGMLNPHG